MEMTTDNRILGVIDEIHELAIRVTGLEIKHSETLRTRDSHAASIAGLILSSSRLETAMVASAEQFKSLNEKIGLGIKVMLGCTALLGSLLGGFWNFQNILDARYAPSIEKQLDQQKATTAIKNQDRVLNDVAEMTDAVGDGVETIKQKKVIRSSK